MHRRPVLSFEFFPTKSEEGERALLGRTIPALRELNPDFILMDINLQGMNGIESTRKIMQERPSAVIMLTAYGDDKTVEQALEAGACYYLVKPIDRDRLALALEKYRTRPAELTASPN